jgi:Mn2+/Fe2+ NRAMP family transporter
MALCLDYAGFDAIKMLFTSAVINGVLAPPLILIVLLLTRDPAVMGNGVNSPILAALGWIVCGVMTLAAAGLFVAS